MVGILVGDIRIIHILIMDIVEDISVVEIIMTVQEEWNIRSQDILHLILLTTMKIIHSGRIIDRNTNTYLNNRNQHITVNRRVEVDRNSG